MSDLSVRRYGLPLLLLLLLSLTAVRYWPHKSSPAQVPGRSGPVAPEQRNDARKFAPPDPAERGRMELAMEKWTPEQRKAFAQRMEADRAFFETLRELPEDQRREKMRAHFEQNPPPPGFDPGSMPPPDGPPPGDGPGFGGPMHLPPPAVRHAMDQQIANSQKSISQ